MTCSSPGTPDRYRKLDLQCADNSSLVVFKQLQRTTVACMLEELMKEDSDTTKHCLRFGGGKCRVLHEKLEIRSEVLVDASSLNMP